VFERFTERARHVVVLAQEEARALGHQYIGTEHILLGLLREEEGMAARVLQSLEITVERVRGQVLRIVGSGEEVTSGQIPFTQRAKEVFELALRESLSLGHNYIGTEHILLGVISEDAGVVFRTRLDPGSDREEHEGVAVRVLHDVGVDAERIRNEVIRLLSSPEALAYAVSRASSASSGRGGPPQFPPPPSKRSTPHTPGGSSGLRFQALHPFHGLRPERPGSAPPLPTRRRATNDAAGFA
jgi:ATP-dependent Clp protease ATP-binding subunit ClpC